MVEPLLLTVATTMVHAVITTTVLAITVVEVLLPGLMVHALVVTTGVVAAYVIDQGSASLMILIAE